MPERLTLFDVDKSIGICCSASPDFPRAADLLAHLSRLGISRALAWHVAARDCSAAWANDRLLEELARTPGAAGRLLPAFSVSPTMLCEPGAVDHLAGLMREHGVRALRYPLMNARWRATHIEPLLADLLPLSPILIIDVRDGIGMPDLLAFAGALSGLLVVLTSVMWPDMVEVMDLMDRRDNVLLSTSWLHSWRALELVADRFGPHRLVFGTGYRSHAGASIAGLARADLPGEARELIAHGTLDRLLGLDAPGPVEDPAPRPMWDNLLQGRSPGPEIIDAHGHIGPLGMYPLPETAPKDHVAAALQWMDALGISTMLISGGEALLADPVAGNMGLQEMLGPHGDRFGGYLAFNPRHAEALASRLDDFFAGDFFVGLKILCDYWRVPVTDPRLTPAWEYANAHRLPVLIHTWGGAHNAPHMLRSIAPRYPDAALILAHSGGSDRKGAVALAEADPNVYLEFAGSFTVPDSWADTIKRVGTDRVVFGTDAVAHSPYWELGRLLSQNIPEDQLVPILATNMSAILARRR